jgi:lipopolysaccharide transport system permease protein
VVNSEHLITKIYFPRMVIPLASIGAALVDFGISVGMLLILMLRFPAHLTLGPSLLLAPVVFLLIVLLALGIGTLFAALNVSYRDVRYVIPFAIQLWLFATPTIYMDLEQPVSRPPAETAVETAGVVVDGAVTPVASESPQDRAQPKVFTRLLEELFSLNPMTGLIATFRAAILGLPIQWARFGYSAAAVAVCFLAGCLYFRRVEDTFPDII